jgi:bacterioferritin-associated ferredoxin
MTARAFLCRCEDVTLGEIDRAIDRGLTTIEELKRYTGLGTGPCQGKECTGALARLLVDRGLARGDALQPFTARPPAEPITLGLLAAARAPFFAARAEEDPDPKDTP